MIYNDGLSIVLTSLELRHFHMIFSQHVVRKVYSHDGFGIGLKLYFKVRFLQNWKLIRTYIYSVTSATCYVSLEIQQVEAITFTDNVIPTSRIHNARAIGGT